MDVDAWPTWASQFERLERIDSAPLKLGHLPTTETVTWSFNVGPPE